MVSRVWTVLRRSGRVAGAGHLRRRGRRHGPERRRSRRLRWGLTASSRSSPPQRPTWRTRWRARFLTWMYVRRAHDYVSGSLLALAVLTKALHDRREVVLVPRYIALLKNGFQPTARGLAQSVPGHRSFRAGALERRPRVAKSSNWINWRQTPPES